MEQPATWTGYDRRSPNRAADPPCPKCAESQQARAVVRTDYVVYFRCARCGQTWILPKPAFLNI
jgi:uncharacterized Zn finger protein